MTPFRRALVMGLTMALAAAGCGRSSDGIPERDWRTLYRHLKDDPTTLDPALVKDVAGGRIIAHIYGTLVTYDAEGNLVGDLAERWDVSPDGKTYTFHLRPGVKFADGSVVTSTDVVRSFGRMLSPATQSPRTWVLDRIRGAKAWMHGAKSIDGLTAPDASSVQIALETPFAPFLGLLTMPAAAVVPPGLTDFNNAGFGSGPFRVAAFRPGERLVLERNPHYRGPGPEVDRVVYRIVDTAVSQMSHYRKGEIDIMDVPGERYAVLSADAKTRDLVHRVNAANVYFLGINCTSPRFGDVRARRALAHAIDASLLVDTILEGRASVARGPIPPGIPGYDPTVTRVAHDPSRARALAADAGFDLAQPVRFLCKSSPDTRKRCEAIAGELEKSGFKVTLMPYEDVTFKQMLRRGDFDVYYYSWWADYFDAENFLAPLFLTSSDRSGGNPTGYSNPRVDALIRAAQRDADADKRATLYAETQRIVLDDCPRVWLWHTRDVTIRQPWVEGYRPSPIYNTDKGNRIRIVKP